MSKDYPLHPGQTHAEPLYAQIPLEEYERLMRENKRLKARTAELERMDTEHTVQIAKMNGYIHHLEEELVTTNALLEQRNADVARLTEERDGLVSERDDIDARR